MIVWKWFIVFVFFLVWGLLDDWCDIIGDIYMNVVLPVWQGRVSGVFDFAGEVLFVGAGESGVESRRSVELKDETGPERVALLRELGVEAVICGAISRPMACMLAGNGIEVFPQVSGEIDDVLEDYKAGRLCRSEFIAGCMGGGRGVGVGRGRGRMRKGPGRGGGRGRSRGRRQV